MATGGAWSRAIFDPKQEVAKNFPCFGRLVHAHIILPSLWRKQTRLQYNIIIFSGMDASSRIFVRGLPPSIAEEDFKKHFSEKASVTDVKLLPKRRFGYVGYKSPEDAAEAVKLFNKSFIRMSRLSVELAQAVSTKTLVWDILSL